MREVTEIVFAAGLDPCWLAAVLLLNQTPARGSEECGAARRSPCSSGHRRQAECEAAPENKELG